MRTLSTLFVAFGLTFGLVGCDVDQTREGRLPEVEVEAEEGQLPAYDVEGPEIETGTRTETIEVPDVDVETREETVEMPTVDIDVPGEEREPE